VIIWKASSPFGREHFVALSEIGLQILVAHGLQHFDAGDLVELPRDGAIVLEADADPVSESGLLHSACGLGVLLGGDGDGGDTAAVGGSGVNAEAAPATADFKHVISGCEVQFLAERVILRALSLLQSLVSAAKLRSGVSHRFVQPELIELVAQVVVLRDVAAAVLETVRSQ